MRFLFFSAEVPGYGGYLVSWSPEAPAVEHCWPVLEQLCVHDWSGASPCVHQPARQRLSWRVIDHAGDCRVRRDAPDQGSAENAWLAALDLQLARGQLQARETGSLLVLLTGFLEVDADPNFREWLARSHHFLDYSLDFVGPEGERLTEDRNGDYRFLEKHEGFVVEA